MPIEEITLSAPGAPTQAPRNESADKRRTDGPPDSARLVQKYLKAARARDRFAFTDSIRERRHERFQQALKTLVKTMATEASREVPDRPARLDLRTRVYSKMMVLAKAMADDHLKRARHARRNLRVSLAFATMGVIGVVATLIANGWLGVGVVG